MNLFLLLTALLSSLTGVGRVTEGRSRPSVSASLGQAVAVASVAPALPGAVRARPSGYVAPRPLMLDLGMVRSFVLAITPERRRE